MKILLGIVGQYRTFEETSTNIYENIINANPDHKFDIILNTDFENKNVIDIFNKKKSYINYDIENLNIKLNNCYGKKLIKIIEYNVNDEDIKNGGAAIFKKRVDITCEYIKNNLEHENYDLYIFIRFDVIICSKLDVTKFINCNKFNFICNDELSLHEREDNQRDWDFCYIFTKLIYNDYFNYKYSSNYKFKDNVTIDDLVKLSKVINFNGNYLKQVKENNYLVESWVKKYMDFIL